MPRLRPELVVNAGFGAWFLATVASQHPHRVFDRLRAFDPTGVLVPNWRFFAPEPAQHDFHVLHRVLLADGDQTDWAETTRIAPRSWLHAVWFPDRRREKAMFDICNELVMLMTTPSVDLTSTAPYELIRDLVELTVRAEYAGGPPPEGFQFVIARHTGHDLAHDPEYLLASPYVPLEP